MHDERHPVIVIGAGLAGLAAALALARRGIPALVLEASDAAGGCCSTTRSGGYTFNNGAVYVAVPSLLRAAFRRLELDFDAQVPMARIAHPHMTCLDSGAVVHLSTAAASHVEGPRGDAQTRQLRDGLSRLQRDWHPIYRTLVDAILPEEPSLARMIGKLWRYLPRLRGHADRPIRAYFPDEDLQAAVASILLYTGIAPARLPASQLIGLVALLEEGFHLPYGGMGAISRSLLHELQRLQVPIRFGAQVRRILAGADGAHGVVLADGERIDADCVIATCSGFAVAQRLLDPGAVPGGLARRARRAPLSQRAVSIQLGCNGASLPNAFIVNHVPPMPRQAAMHVSMPGAPRWLAYTNPCRTLPDLAPAGKAVIELYAPASGIDSASEWTTAMTEAVVADHLDALAARLPGLSVDVVRALGPQQFAHERHLHEGALYGIAPGAPPDALFPRRSGIRGLYLAGQTTFPGYGVGPALQSGILAADALHADLRMR